MALICDTGPLLAALDRDDPDHAICSELFSQSAEDLVVPGLVLGELDYWCRELGLQTAWLAFLEDVEQGAWRLEWPTVRDLHRARWLQATYMNLALGVVDASIIALLERLSETRLVTLDHQHFIIVHPTRVAPLTYPPRSK